MPFQSLMAKSERVTAAARDDFAAGCRATFASSEIKPSGQCAAGCLHVIETHVNVAFRVVAVCGLDVGARSGQETHCQLADSEMHVFESRAVTAHIERIEIVYLNVLA